MNALHSVFFFPLFSWIFLFFYAIFTVSIHYPDGSVLVWNLHLHVPQNSIVSTIIARSFFKTNTSVWIFCLLHLNLSSSKDENFIIQPSPNNWTKNLIEIKWNGNFRLFVWLTLVHLSHLALPLYLFISMAVQKFCIVNTVSAMAHNTFYKSIQHFHWVRLLFLAFFLASAFSS